MRFKSLTVMAATLSLLGCGGGSGSGDNSTPGPGTPPAQNIKTLTIEGIATDAPIANGKIVARFGSQQYVADTDANGHYSLDIQYDANNYQGSSLVQLRATGQGNQSHIELVSQLGSFDTLIRSAGSDSTLSHQESKATAITQLSTALYILMLDTGIELNSDASLNQARTDVEQDPYEVLQLASIIKTLADNPDYTPTFGTTLSVLTKQSEGQLSPYVDAYLTSHGWLDADGNYSESFDTALSDAREQTLSDGRVIYSFSSSEMEGEHLATVPVAPGWVAKSGTVFHFSLDGTGTMSPNSSISNRTISDNIDIQWKLANSGQLEITPEPNQQITLPYVTLDEIKTYWGEEVAKQLADLGFSYGQVTVLENVESVEATRLSGSATPMVHLTTEISYTLEKVEGFENWISFNPSYSRTFEDYNIWSLANTFETVWQQAPSGNWVISLPTEIQSYFGPVGEPDIALVPQMITLSDNGALLNLNGESLGSWRFDNGQLSVSTNDGWQLNYLPYASVPGLLSARVEIRRGDLNQHVIDWLLPANQEQSSLEKDLIQTLPKTLGAWLSAWQRYGSSPKAPKIDYIWSYQFRADGTMSRVWPDADNRVFIADTNLSQWHQVAPYVYKLEGELETSFRTIKREREWRVISTLEGGLHMVLETPIWSSIHSDPTKSWVGHSVHPRINVLAPVDLSQFEEIYQRSMEQGTLDGLN